MNYKNTKNTGMTLPELILAVLMLSSFTAVTVMVTQFISRFFQPLNEGAKNEYMLNHHIQINEAFDSIIEILSEQGIDKIYISNLPKCTSLPSSEPPNGWNISVEIPKSYKICIKPTSLVETNYAKLADPKLTPGIYILYSKPIDGSGVSFKATPVRRIFCRPKPFCKKP